MPRARRRAGDARGVDGSEEHGAACRRDRASQRTQPQSSRQTREDLAAANDLTPALRDRLMLDAKRVEAMAKGVEDVAALPDPVGRELARWTVPSGLDIARVATPIGVIGMIYESRPNVTADAAALALKSGNVCILRGGSESAHSSAAIHAAMLEGLRATGLPQAAISRVPTTDRAAVGLMLEGLDGSIDLIIPRGGKGLTSRVMAEARGARARAPRRCLPCLYSCGTRIRPRPVPSR